MTPIAFTHRATFHGPNPFSRDPVVVVEVAVPPALAGEATRIMADLAALSAPWFNGLDAASGKQPGDWQLAMALVQWSRAALTFVRGYLSAAGVQVPAQTPPVPRGTLTAWLGFHDPSLSLATAQLGVRLLQALSKGQVTPAQFESVLAPIWRACRELHPDYQARILMEAARDMDVPYSPAWSQARHWQFGQGARSRVMFESSSADDGAFGARISSSKAVSKATLVALGLPVPVHVLVHDETELAAAVRKVGFPCATKPLNLGGGKGVNAGHQTLDDVRAGFREARAASMSTSAVMVEAFVPGDDYRLMVVDGILRAAIRRQAAQVVGDGRRTVRALVEAQNATRDARSLVASAYLRPVKLDEPALRYMAQQGVGLDTVLADGQSARLRSNANLSTGGSCADVTATVHPHVRTLAETLARTLNLRTMGADYLTTDVSRAPREVGGAFIEFNTTPGLDALITAGWSALEAGRLALGEAVGRIQLDLLLVPDVELAAMTGALSQRAWPSTGGWASATHAMLAGLPLRVPVTHPWAGVHTLLAHKTLERALLLCGMQALQRHGLPSERLRTVYLCGVVASADWQQVLKDAAERISLWPDATSALRAYETSNVSATP